MTTIGERINYLRNQKGISMSDLAKVIGTNSSAISSWENNQKTPSTYLAIAIADYFDVSLDWLLRDKQVAEIKQIDVVNETNNISNIYRGLPIHAINTKAIEVYQRIELLAKENDISIKDVAEKSDLSLQTLYRWKNGKSDPSYHALQSISDTLNTSYSYLSQGVEEVHSKYGIDIYAKIFYAVEERGTTFVRLERGTGISRQSLIDMAIGRSRPDYKDLEVIANYLEVPRNWLVNGEYNDLPHTKNPLKAKRNNENKFLNQYKSLSERDKREVEEIIKLKLKLSKEFEEHNND